MHPGNLASYVLLGSALLISGLAIPLILGRVKRNRWYGFRTASTLASDRVWYPANRSMGWALLLNGIIMAVLVAAILLRLPGFSLLYVLIYLPLSSAVMLAFGYRKLAQLNDERSDR